MEKKLVIDNPDKAQVFIDKIEGEFIPVLNMIISGVKALDLPAPSRDQVKKILKDDFSDIDTAYHGLIQSDVAKFKTSAVKAEMSGTASKKLNEFKHKTRESLSGAIDHYKLNDPFFWDLFDINKDGRPYLTDEGRENIELAFQEVVSDSKHIKVAKKLEAASTSLQELWDAIVSANMQGDFGVISNAPLKLMMNLFDVKTTPQGDDEFTAKHTIVARKINFEFFKKS